MAFNVRIFGYRGIQQIPTVLPKQFSSDSVFQVVEPYEFSETVVVSAVAARMPPSDAPGVNLIRMEVPDGSQVRYEINPPNRSGGGERSADVDSPITGGKDYFYFQPGWSVSLIDAAGLP